MSEDGATHESDHTACGVAIAYSSFVCFHPPLCFVRSFHIGPDGGSDIVNWFCWLGAGELVERFVLTSTDGGRREIALTPDSNGPRVPTSVPECRNKAKAYSKNPSQTSQ
jgi:hypothetical protein